LLQKSPPEAMRPVITHRHAAISAALVLAAIAPTSARAESGQSRRYCTVFKETLDGEARSVSAAETAFQHELLEKGMTLVDEAQSRKIRSVTDAGKLLEGTIPEVITTLDADVIVAGVVSLVKVPSKLLSEKVSRFDATIQAKVISVDTGSILAAVEMHGE